MFDIGFPELMLVSIVALLVIGPDKLPAAVRTLALWVGRFRRSLASIKAEIEQEIGADEIRQQLHNESIMKDLSDTREQLEGIVNETKQTITEAKQASRGLSSADLPLPKELASDQPKRPDNGQ
jgi:sec-independent protein translocase protein TatB